MKQSELLLKRAVETAICEGHTLENAQVAILAAFAQIAATNGPKNLFRLVNENRVALIADRAREEYVIPTYPNATKYVAVPELTVRAATSWLIGLDREEREVALELNALVAADLRRSA